jgi:hypothetical protein
MLAGEEDLQLHTRDSIDILKATTNMYHRYAQTDPGEYSKNLASMMTPQAQPRIFNTKQDDRKRRESIRMETVPKRMKKELMEQYTIKESDWSKWWKSHCLKAANSMPDIDKDPEIKELRKLHQASRLGRDLLSS